MEQNYEHVRQAVQDFHNARQSAVVEEILARMTGKSNQLLSYEEVAQKLKLRDRSERGVQNIPVAAIVGSVGRYTDFTRTFLPRNPSDEQRWAHVKASILDAASTGWPPIEVYKVSDVYFVLDGNHRVSIARQENMKTIEAHVIEIRTDVPLTPDTSPDDLIVKAEYAGFLEETDLARLRPNVDLSVTIPGQYTKLMEHIQVNRYYLDEKNNWQTPIPFQEALLDWYDNHYIPFAETIRDREVMQWFPNRTITDLYLWISEHREALEKTVGFSISPQRAAELVVQQSPAALNEELAPGSWRKAKLVERYTDRLFHEILVPLSGGPMSWEALQQALDVARRDGSQLHGMHVVDSPEKINAPEALAVKERFQAVCEEAGVSGSLFIESGEISRKIMERSVLADMIVLKVVYPPGAGFSGLASPIRAIISQAPRPILTIPGDARRLERALLAYDGSLRAKEALFVATYMAEQWGADLTVYTATDGGRLSKDIQEYAREYLELHEVNAQFVLNDGGQDTLKNAVMEHKTDVVLMGGYSGSALKEVVLGSSVNMMLRELSLPVLICR